LANELCFACGYKGLAWLGEKGQNGFMENKDHWSQSSEIRRLKDKPKTIY